MLQESGREATMHDMEPFVNGLNTVTCRATLARMCHIQNYMIHLTELHAMRCLASVQS